MGGTQQECIIRPAASLEEVQELWWPLMQTLGWNRSYNDAYTHYKVAGSNWLMCAPAPDSSSVGATAASPAAENKPEGCVATFVFSNRTGWLGFFIMNASFRGFGFGGKLFKAGLDRFAAAGTEFIGLDAVKEQVGTYSRRGFVEVAKVRLMAREGVEKGQLGDDEGTKKLGQGEQVVPLGTVEPEKLVSSELRYTGFERPKLWSEEAMFGRDDVSGFAVLSEQGHLLAWILVRKCQEGYRMGPLYADRHDLAYAVLHAAMKSVEGKGGSLAAEAWPQNPGAIQLFEELGWAWAQLDYHRMWVDGKVPEAQREGGAAQRGMFAIFDAAEG